MERIIARAVKAPPKNRAWILDNVRLLNTTEKQAVEFVGALRGFPGGERALGRRFSSLRWLPPN